LDHLTPTMIWTRYKKQDSITVPAFKTYCGACPLSLLTEKYRYDLNSNIRNYSLAQ
jgi:hypothetical protein